MYMQKWVLSGESNIWKELQNDDNEHDEADDYLENHRAETEMEQNLY